MFGSGFIYIACVALFCIGFYGLIASFNIVKKMMSLSIMQTSIILLYIAIGYRGAESVAPVYRHSDVIYANPLPQVLMLTAIVVGLAINAVGLALVIQLKKHFGSKNAKSIDSMCHYDRIYIADSVRKKISLIGNNNTAMDSKFTNN
ncbi:MAG: cation:proton antiporter subunit C [Alphaproteobacteria bacterium]|nr:cation:proton antiporter subunit C [Rickettsiales bacterium]